MLSIPSDYPAAQQKVDPLVSVPYEQEGDTAPCVGTWTLPLLDSFGNEAKDDYWSASLTQNVSIDSTLLAEGLEDGDQLSLLLQGKSIEASHDPTPRTSLFCF